MQWGIPIVLAGFFVYMRFELLYRKLVVPIRNWIDRNVNRYTVRESQIQEIEANENTLEIFVVVNHLHYELDDDLRYDEIMAKNLNREVSYYYLLPKSIRADWDRLLQHLRSKGVGQSNLTNHLKARFVDDRLTSIVVYGLAIYIGRHPYSFKEQKHKVIAIQYSKDYSHSILVETTSDARTGARTVDSLMELLTSSKQKFKCNCA